MRDILLGGLVTLFAAAPSSTNYILRNYDIGSGGSSSSSSTNYRLNGVSGTQTGQQETSTNYSVSPGLSNSQTANVPLAPTFTNPDSFYNRLLLQLNPGQDPSDTKYLIAISTDDFVTTNYIQVDNTIGSSNALTNYQSYTAWGGASGVYVVGLTPSTTYKVKVKAIQGGYTNSGYGPTATASTTSPNIVITLSTTLSTTPPFAINFPALTPGAVSTANADIQFALSTNAYNGGAVYIKSENSGLKSNLANSTIASASVDLTSAQTGYGAQVTASSQASGGPFTAVAPYNVSSNNVGALSSNLQPILKTDNTVTTATSTIRLLAKSTTLTPSAPDYSDTVTLIAAMLY
jgi:hypothetical protein